MSNKNFYSLIKSRDKLAYNFRFVLEHFLGFGVFQKVWNKWNQRTQSRIYTSVQKIQPQKLMAIECDAAVDPSKLRDLYVKRGKPVVIRKGACSWSAFKKWDFEFFRNEYGDHPVLLSNHKDVGDVESESVVTNLREIIDGIDKNSMRYARFNPLLDCYPILQQELNQDWLDQVRDTRIKKHHVLFIGNKGTKTNIHNAGNENIFVQIRGKKRWLLWDQEAYYVINPEVNRAPAKSSPIDPNIGSVKENLAYNHLPYYELVLEPGDIIYIPSYLWHYVENLTPTIGIGNRWLSPRSTIRNNTMFAILEIFNTSPTIFETLDWRNGFDFNNILNYNKKKNKAQN